MHARQKIISVVIILAAIIIVAFFVFIKTVYSQRSASKIQSESAQTFVVSEGDSAREIVKKLKENDLIDSELISLIYLRFAGIQDDLRAGNFTLSQTMSVKEIFSRLVESTLNEITITIPEGWTIKQIGQYLEKKGIATAQEWASAAGENEGYLFPDTYRIFADSTAEDIVKKMQQNFENKIDSIREEIVNSGKSLNDIIIMASIIEREVRASEDKKIVADIFWTRVDIGMALQADSTVNYVTGKDSPAITLDDRELDSPYNTYKYRGLPPGAISNPGIDSIEAALRPTSTNYLYFLTDDQGKVYYATTLEEHNRNKALYR